MEISPPPLNQVRLQMAQGRELDLPPGAAPVELELSTEPIEWATFDVVAVSYVLHVLDAGGAPAFGVRVEVLDTRRVPCPRGLADTVPPATVLEGNETTATGELSIVDELPALDRRLDVHEVWTARIRVTRTDTGPVSRRLVIQAWTVADVVVPSVARPNVEASRLEELLGRPEDLAPPPPIVDHPVGMTARAAVDEITARLDAMPEEQRAHLVGLSRSELQHLVLLGNDDDDVARGAFNAIVLCGYWAELTGSPRWNELRIWTLPMREVRHPEHGGLRVHPMMEGASWDRPQKPPDYEHRETYTPDRWAGTRLAAHALLWLRAESDRRYRGRMDA